MAFKVIHPHTSTGTTETIKTRIGKGEIAIQHPAAGDASLFTIDANGDAVEFISGAAVDKKNWKQECQRIWRCIRLCHSECK